MTKTITYTGMLWLLAAQFVVMLPFTLYLPWWLIPIMVAAVVWRLRVLKGYSAQPKALFKVGLMALGVGGLLLSGLPFPSLDGMLAILLLGFALKSLEVVHLRDAIIVVFLGYLLVALHFVYTQSMGAALYGVVGLTILTGALIGVQPTVAVLSPMQAVRKNLRLASLMLLQAIPLMLVVFVLTPRLPPLWTLPLMQTQAKTGISDSMAPGDIENLTQSDELAFRVTFQNTRPKQSELYWRGLTFNYFDGKTWTQLPKEFDPAQFNALTKNDYAFQDNNQKIQGNAIQYEALYTASSQPWLFTLTPALNVEGDVKRLVDYRVMANQALQSPLLVKATSYPQTIRDLTLNHLIQRLALQLPANTNPRTHELAQQWWRESGNNIDTYVARVMSNFRTQGFTYTLTPPLLGDKDTIDGFLLDSKQGFCSHYAGSFVFLMRAVGIPARVVLGYQGGEWNNKGNYLAVRQYDAHAWVEIWQEGKGWTELDPTSVVAPNRITNGLDAVLERNSGLLLQSLRNAQKMPWLNAIQQRLDALQYNWQRWVVGYDHDTQSSMLSQLFGDMSIQKILVVAVSVFGGIGAIWFVWLGLGRRSKLPLEQQVYQQFCKVLAKHHIQREALQTPSAFAQAASLALPNLAEPIQRFTAHYQALCYDPDANYREHLIGMRHALKQLKRGHYPARMSAPVIASRISEG